jgi:hypothetical protein
MSNPCDDFEVSGMTRKLVPNLSRFDFGRFIDSITDLNFTDMGSAVDQECKRVEASMTGRGSPQARADGGATMSLASLAACRQLAVKLIEKGQLKSEALDLLGP